MSIVLNCTGWTKLFFNFVDLCNFVINEFDQLVKLREMVMGLYTISHFKNFHFKMWVFKTQFAVASGEYWFFSTFHRRTHNEYELICISILQVRLSNQPYVRSFCFCQSQTNRWNQKILLRKVVKCAAGMKKCLQGKIYLTQLSKQPMISMEIFVTMATPRSMDLPLNIGV